MVLQVEDAIQRSFLSGLLSKPEYFAIGESNEIVSCATSTGLCCFFKAVAFLAHSF